MIFSLADEDRKQQYISAKMQRKKHRFCLNMSPSIIAISPDNEPVKHYRCKIAECTMKRWYQVSMADVTFNV